MSSSEIRELRRRARCEGKNVSAYIRGAILPPARKAGRPRLVRDMATGSLVLKHPDGTPPLTSEMVREALADFP